MIAVLIGEVVQTTGKTFVIKDEHDSKLIDCTSLEDMPLGTAGLFIGEHLGNNFRVNRIDHQKIVKPLHEEELVTFSSNFVQMDLVNSPFGEMYNALLQQKPSDHLIEEK